MSHIRNKVKEQEYKTITKSAWEEKRRPLYWGNQTIDEVKAAINQSQLRMNIAHTNLLSWYRTSVTGGRESRGSSNNKMVTGPCA